MKRPLLPALIIGLIAAAIVLGLHVSGLLQGPELAIKNLLLRRGPATRSVFDQMQYPFVLILACGVAWMTLVTSRRAQLGGIIAILLVELLGIAWVCSLYQVFFPPFPAISGTALGFLLPIGFLELSAFARRRRSLPALI